MLTVLTEVPNHDGDGDGVVVPPGGTAGVVAAVLQPGPADHQPAVTGGLTPLQVEHPSTRVRPQVQSSLSDIPSANITVLQDIRRCEIFLARLISTLEGKVSSDY